MSDKTQQRLGSEASQALKQAIAAATVVSVELSAEAQQVIDALKETRKAADLAHQQIERSRKIQHSAVDEAHNEQTKAVKKSLKDETKAARQRLIDLGVKNPDLVLSDTVVVKKLDKGAKKGLGFIGKGLRYVREGIKSGEESSTDSDD